MLARLILRSFWLLDGKAKNDAWESMSQGGFFNADFLKEVEGLKADAIGYRQQLAEQGLRL